jgi:hypothetical protein
MSRLDLAFIVLALVATSCERPRTGTSTPQGEVAGSQALAHARMPNELERVAALPARIGAPEGIAVDPSGDRAVVYGQLGAHVIAPTGTRTLLLERDRFLAIANDDGFVWGGRRHRWDDARAVRLPGIGLFDEGGTELAARLDDKWWTAVMLVRPPRDAAAVHVQAERLDESDAWALELEGAAAAAIAADGRVALATQEGRVIVLAAAGDGDGEPRTLLELAIEPAPYAIAIDERGFTVLAAPEPSARGDWERISAPSSWRPSSRWSTEVVRFTSDGRETWRRSVDFVALQPPRLAAGLVVVAGLGAAALRERDGNVVWSRESSDRIFTAVMADGTALLTLGSALEVLDADGRTRSRLPTPGGDAIACPPAVATNGTVWAATTREILRSRAAS